VSKYILVNNLNAVANIQIYVSEYTVGFFERKIVVKIFQTRFPLVYREGEPATLTTLTSETALLEEVWEKESFDVEDF